MIINEEDYLEHFGVRGMKWGVRKNTSTSGNSRDGVSRKVDRDARKDAEEFSRAKMYYGEGAGVRRKLIKNTVEAKKAKDPNYAKAFDKHSKTQDMSKHASKAVKERKTTDRKDKTKKTVATVARKFTGEHGTQAAFTALAITGIAFLNSPKGQQMYKTAVKQVTNVVNSKRQQDGAKIISDWLNTHS